MDLSMGADSLSPRQKEIERKEGKRKKDWIQNRWAAFSIVPVKEINFNARKKKCHVDRYTRPMPAISSTYRNSVEVKRWKTKKRKYNMNSIDLFVVCHSTLEKRKIISFLSWSSMFLVLQNGPILTERARDRRRLKQLLPCTADIRRQRSVIPRSGRRSSNLVLLSHDKQDLGDSMLTRFQLPLGGRVMVTVVWNLIRTIDPSFCLFSFWENIRIFPYQTVHQLLTVASNEKSTGSGSSSRRKIFRIKLKKVVVKSNAVLVFLVFIFSKIKRNNMAEGKKEYLQYSPACP